MASSVGDDLSALLHGLQSGGSFSTCRTAPVGDLAIEVAGVGVGGLGLPVTAAQAKQLRLIARPAKYGQGELTILDRRVRDTWEIPRSRVRIDKRRWNNTLKPMLATIRDDLGLPPEVSLTAELHSMLLYERGQFFAAHQDSEKDDQMVATLVVLLPSRSTGGDLIVSHRGESVRYRGSASSLTFVAFYADTRHEVLPIETGSRVALTYNLLLKGTPTALPADNASIAAEVAKLLHDHFEHIPDPRWRGDRDALAPADRLVVLLDHQYTERGLRWSHLKGDDAVRVEVLRSAAELAGCEVALAQAEVQETRDCYDDEPRWGRRGWSDWDEEPDGDGDRFTVGDVLDSTLEIVPAIGEAARFDRAVSSAEVIEVSPTDALEPYDSEYTGYMGNWGNTMDRWYRRAAVVIWPRTRAFAIRAKGDPLAALDDLLSRTGADEASRAARSDDAVTLLRFWADGVRRGDQRALLPKTLLLAQELDNEELADGLLEPFAIEAIAPTDATALVAVAGQRGPEWSGHRLTGWIEQRRPFHTSPTAPLARAEWLNELPELCANLQRASQDRGRSGTKIARLLTTHMADWLIDAIGRSALTTTPSRRDDALAGLAGPMLAVLRSAGVVDAPKTRDRVIGAACEHGLRTIPMLVDVVRACSLLAPDEQKTVGCDLLGRHCQQVLTDALKEPQRTQDDWSINEFEHADCCDDCATLALFLAEPTAQKTTWPLAKARRQHIHHRIDEFELPLTHRTIREGSPHKLVLTKTADLHRRDIERRTRITEILDQI